jgi:hypothetical protein
MPPVTAVESIPEPNPDSVESAVSVLQAELALTDGHLDAIDRKAALLPPFLVGVAALLLRDGAWTVFEAGLNIVALIVGSVAVVYCLTILRPGRISVGPEATVIAHHTHLPPPEFHLRVAVSLADAIDLNTRRTKVKADRLRTAGWLAAATMFLLVLARVAGGIGVTDDSGAPPPSNSASPSPATEPASAPPAAPSPSAPASPGEPSPSTGDRLPDFGQQMITASEPRLPSFGQQWAEKGGPLPRDTEIRVEKSGDASSG